MPETGEIDLLKLRAFPQIGPDAFQHPDDRNATEALEKIPAFPQLIRYIYGGVFETAWRLQHLSHCIRVGPRQARTLHRHYVRAAEILSIAEIPELFISPGSELNAYAIGRADPRGICKRNSQNCASGIGDSTCGRAGISARRRFSPGPNGAFWSK